MQFLFIMRLSSAARFSVITGLIGLYSIHVSAQQMKLGDNPSVLKKDALLELNSANQGLLLPRVLKSQISAGGKLFAAEDGMFVFVSDEKSLYVKRFGIWQKVGDVSATSITGDVDVTGSGALTTTINPKAVTYAKMQDITASSLLGRYSATNGTTQEIKLGTNLSFNTSTGVLNAAGVTSLTGDVTAPVTTGAAAATITAKAVTYAKIQDVTSQSLLGRYGAGDGVTQEVKIGSNMTLNATTGMLTANAGSALWNANQLQGRNVVTTAPADGDVLKYNSTTSVWEPAAAGGITSINGAILANGTGAVTAYIADGAVAYSKIQAMPGQTILGRYSTTLGVTQEITIGSNMTLNSTTGVLSANAGNALWNASQLQGRTVGTTTPASGNVLKWNGTSWDAAADAGGITALTSDVTASGTGSVAATITAKAVTYAKIQDVTASSLLGRYNATNGVTQEISLGSNMTLNSTTGVLSANAGTALWNASQLQGRAIGTTTPTNGQVLKWNGTSWDAAADAGSGITALTSDVTASGTGSVAATIATKAVTYAKMQDVAGSSLLGRYNNSTGTVQEIKIGGTLSFNTGTGTLSATGISGLSGDVTASGTSGTVAATIANKAVTYAKIQDVAGSSLLGRYNNSTGTVQEIKIGGTLSFNTTTGTLSASGISDLTGDVTTSGSSGSVAATIASKAVTFAKFQDLSTQTLVGRYSTGTGVAQEVKITGGNLLLNNSTGILSADNNSAVWNANKLLSRNLSTTAPGNGEVLKYNTSTSAWEPSADLNGGATYGTLANNDIAQADAPDNFSRMKIWASPVTGTVTNGPLGTGAYSWNVLSFRGGGYTTQLYFDKSTLAVKEWGGNNATLTTNAGNPWYKMVMTHGDANIDNGAIVFGGKTHDASTEVKSDVTKLYFDNTNKRLGVGTNTPNSTVQVTGSLSAGVYINTSGNVAADASMFTIVVRRTSGTNNVTVTLPAANTCTGRIYYVVRDYSNADGSVTITGASGEVTNKVMWNNPEIYCVQSIGTKWIYLTYGPAW